MSRAIFGIRGIGRAIGPRRSGPRGMPANDCAESESRVANHWTEIFRSPSEPVSRRAYRCRSRGLLSFSLGARNAGRRCIRGEPRHRPGSPTVNQSFVAGEALRVNHFSSCGYGREVYNALQAATPRYIFARSFLATLPVTILPHSSEKTTYRTRS